MNVLIIEDEARSARELAEIIIAINAKVKILATLVSVEQSLDWFENNLQPDLIFSDIQLADGLSFNIYEKVKITCPIIFCTAFDEYLMNAFDTNAISYLLKPITKVKVKKALEKLTGLQNAFKQNAVAFPIEKLLSQVKLPYKTTLLVNQREKIIPIQLKEIAYFYLDNTVVEVCTLHNHKYFITSSMDELEKTVDPKKFYRANRQFLVNRDAVSAIERFFSRKLAIKMSIATPDTVLISKTKAGDFLKWLEGPE